MFSLLLLTLTPLARDCSPPDYNEARYQRPIQASGKGLWIGGIAFDTSDIASMEPVLQETGDAWSLRIRFTPAGLKKFVRAQRCGIGSNMEVSIDREVLFRPRLNEPVVEAHIWRYNGNSRADAEAIASWIRRSSAR